MCVLASLFAILVNLNGVTGETLRTRAFFDANNVKVGDPLVLTIDFIGEAQFRDLHPPKLARALGGTDWKIDDVSAKTDTYRNARRLTYRVRPMREGVLRFPSIDFSFVDSVGKERITRSNEIPVHAKSGAQVALNIDEDLTALPKPPELITEVEGLDDDVQFAWRKALSKPSADAFAAFAFPEAKMNEATMAIREGNWSRALSVYSKLEWRIGQTEAIERGIIAALALKSEDPSAELPVWRGILRPVLRHAWPLRVLIVFGTLLALFIFFKLAGRAIKALACLALALSLPFASFGETIETVTTNANGMIIYRKVTTNGPVGQGIQPSSFFAGFDDMDPFASFGRRKQVRRPKVEIAATLAADKSSVTVGENFNLVLTLDAPKFITFDEGIRLSIVEQDRMTQTGQGTTLRPTASTNPTNVLQRLVFPMRANVAFTNLHYSVQGAYAFQDDSFFFRESHPFSTAKLTTAFVVGDLPRENRPADFSGIIAKSVSLHELCDIIRVETNDVVTITTKLKVKGFVPAEYEPKGVAFEWQRLESQNGAETEIEYRRYFVADGTSSPPPLEISYYDPEARQYKRVRANSTELKYTSSQQ